MRLLVEFTVDCPKCGEPASSGNTLFSDYEPGRPLQVDLELTGSQMEFTCADEDCGVRCGTGDIEVFLHPDDEDDESDEPLTQSEVTG
jgi:hypothetical protein